MHKQPEPLIPRAVLFADPDKIGVKLSPDAKWLSFLAPNEGVLNLWIAPLDNPTNAKPITSSQQPIKEYWWAPNSDKIIFAHDSFGDENWQLHGVLLSEQKVLTYTKPGCHTKVLKISSQKPDHLLIGLNERSRHYHDVYLLDLNTGQLEIIYENSRYWDFLADENLQLRAALTVEKKGGGYWDITTESAQHLLQVEQHDLLGLYFYPRLRLGLSKEGQKLFLVQSVKHNTSRVSYIDMDTHELHELAGNDEADIADIILDPRTHTPIAYATIFARKKWRVIDVTYQEDLDFLNQLAEGDLEIVSQSTDNAHWVVGFIQDNGPIEYYHYHRPTKQAKFLFNSQEALKKISLAKMRPVNLPTRDGLYCMSYLSLPRACELNQEGFPQVPLPLILWVHGGPNFRDFWGFNPIHQWLTNRGYAVLSVNYRASTGFGKAHAAAGNGEWGRKIQQDLLDAVEWAIQKNITTQDKVAIMGRSFGGYATLMGLTSTPEVYCCGVDVVGPANLETLVQQFPPYWKTMRDAFQEMLGCNPDTPEGKAFLRERSPLFAAQRITKPLLIGHGANDVRVLQSESDQMAAALKENEIPVTYVVFPDEGHQFMKPGNRMAFYALIEAFLAKNLGGRSEPFEQGYQTSMVVKEDDFHLLPFKDYKSE